MDIDSCIVNPIINQGTIRSLQDFLSHQQLYHNGPGNCLADGQVQTKWICSPHNNGLDNSRIGENIRNEITLDWRTGVSDNVPDTGSTLFEGSSLKGCLQQGILPYQSQNVVHYQSNDSWPRYGACSLHEPRFSPSWQTRSGLEVSPGFYNRNRSYTIPSSAGNSLRDSIYFQQSSNNDLEIRSFVASDGKNIPSLVGGNQIAAEVFSPEQISSVTACSDPDWYSDKDTFEDGVTFAATPFSEPKLGDSNWFENVVPSLSHVDRQSFSGDYLEVDKNITLLPRHSSTRIPKDLNTLSSEIYSKPKLINEGLSQPWMQMLQLNQSHQQAFPAPSQFNIPRENQLYGPSGGQNFHNVVTGERQLKQPLEHLYGFRQQEICDLQGLDPAKVHKILSLYYKFKGKPLDADRNHQEFLNHLHMTVCNARKCDCGTSIMLVSHLDKCNHPNCEICGQLRQCFPAGEMNLGSNFEASMMTMSTVSGKLKADFPRGLYCKSYSLEELEPLTKRIKVENAVPIDDWSLGAVTLSAKLPEQTKCQHSVISSGGPANDETCVGMNKELPRANEIPKAHIVQNDAADSGGSTCTQVYSREKGERLHLGLTCEGPISGAMLNNEISSALVNLGRSDLKASDSSSDNQYLGNDGTYFNSNLANLFNKSPQCVISSEVGCDGILRDDMPALREEPPVNQDEKTKLMSEAEGGRMDANSNLAKSDCQSGKNFEGFKALGISVTDFFTAKQIKEHLHSLCPGSKVSAEKDAAGNTDTHSVGENTCQLCNADRLMFTPPPMYCTSCGARIKRGSTYYWTLDELGVQCCFCTLCFKESRGGNISFRGLSFSKAKLNKGKNTEESEEAWVQCDNCECWQHQICALYNSRQDLEGKGNYICPICRLSEIAAKEHVPHPHTFGAKDLPRTILSDHIEKRLHRRLDQDRKERAKALGKSPDEVAAAENLIVRVVLSVKKELKVKQQFLDILHGENYPSEFPYRSKVILLFQTVEGVDVCLFAMYVQEYGSECGQPNQRSVYISYLDSVKYFRPEIRTASGVALRTFVYHEILRGYLGYCKQRGFTTCYIWACPPLKGEDYILYCHPESQRTPKSDKLCLWYKMMLRAAQEENIVVEHTNFYDYFFVPSGASDSKITAARLPYFDGDYWSGAIEDILRAIEKDTGGESERKTKKQMSKRTLKAMGHSDLSVDATKDIMVMQKLGHAILSAKQDFIVAHLQFTCINCHAPILSGSRWSCNLCSNFHLCNRCLEVKQPNGLETHTNIRGETHLLHQIPVDDVPADTEDNDIILDTDVLGNRHSFLNFCQQNHYQFDTLRRAKHSSMMILYHLHKTTALSMGTICSICHQDTMMEWHCEICPQFCLCNDCYKKYGDGCHIHKLTRRSGGTTPETKIKKMQHQRGLQDQELLDLLLHTNQCSTKNCLYPKCRKLKLIFLHSRECKVRASGGCFGCRKIWYLMKLHARYCRDSNCRFPRCSELKNREETLKAQSENLRRTAVTAVVTSPC